MNTVLQEVKKEFSVDESLPRIYKKTGGRCGLKVVFDGEKYEIEYAAPSALARAELLLKANGNAPFCVEEKTDFENIGFMVDCSRNAVPTVETQKKLIRNLALLGYTELYLYMEETYEVPSEPTFGYLRGGYTQAELKEIDAYGVELGVEVIPCIQTLAHFNQLKRWKGELFDCNDILCCGQEEVYTLIDDMLASLRSCFTTNKIHLGMDEAPLLGKGRYCDEHGLRPAYEVFMEHLERVLAISEKYGFKPMIWGDTAYLLMENHQDVLRANPKYQELFQRVDLMYWDYYSIEKSHYEEKLKGYEKITNNLRFAGGVWKWKGFVPANEYSIKTIDAALPPLKKHGVKQIITTAWGDNGAESPLFSILPSAAYFSLKALGYSKREMKKLFKALTGYTFDGFMKSDDLDARFSNRADKKPVNPSKYFLYNDLFNGCLDVLADESKKGIFAEVRKSLRGNARGKYGYIFECQRALADALTVKYDLGVRTRTAYQAQDIAGLQAVVKDIDLLLRKLEIFHKAFFKQWLAENKPNGFDAQDLRLGGLKERLKACRARLKEYLQKGTPIPELEQSLYEGAFGKKTTDDMCYNTWAKCATVNII